MSDADPFANDVLERLVRSNGDYQREHGHYIVPLAERLLATRVELEQVKRELAELQAYVHKQTEAWSR